MRVFGGSPILGIVLGLILMHPQLVSQYDLAKGIFRRGTYLA